MSQQTLRTKEKIVENLGLLMDALQSKYGEKDVDIERMIFNALSWTADDVQKQFEAISTPASAIGSDGKSYPIDDPNIPG